MYLPRPSKAPILSAILLSTSFRFTTSHEEGRSSCFFGEVGLSEHFERPQAAFTAFSLTDGSFEVEDQAIELDQLTCGSGCAERSPRHMNDPVEREW